MNNYLKVHRAIKDYTQETLAKKVGVSRQTINSIEKNRYVPSTVLALKIAKALDSTVDKLFKLEPDD